MSKFTEMQFKVDSSLESTKLQEKLFSLGYHWLHHDGYPQYIHEPYILTDTHGSLLWEDDADCFNSNYRPLMDTKHFINDNTEIKSVNLITINNKHYSLDDVTKAIRNLTTYNLS